MSQNLVFADNKIPKPSVQHSSGGAVPSLLKWSGSKRSQASRIAKYAPEYDRYYEPFLGGGALLYLLGKPRSVGADLYKPLIDFWTLVRDNPDSLIANYRDQWLNLQESLPEYFYVVRKRFNETKQPEDLNFLMRTCVNGIVRFSQKGDFNNSFHLSRKGMQPDRFAKIVQNWNEQIVGVDFRCADFEESLADASRNDFVYLDPPYVGNKQRYIGDLDVERFMTVLDDLSRRGVKWALSFDGNRGEQVYKHNIPKDMFKRKVDLQSGYSAVNKVLNGAVDMVTESLYLNY